MSPRTMWLWLLLALSMVSSSSSSSSSYSRSRGRERRSRAYIRMYHDVILRVSPAQRVRKGGEARLDCVVREVGQRTGLRWVRLDTEGGYREVDMVAYTGEDGVVAEEDRVTGEVVEGAEGQQVIWRMRLAGFGRRDAGMYQCQVDTIARSIII